MIQQGSGDYGGSIRFWIDSIDQQSRNIVIQGWLLKNKENMAAVNNRALLRDITDDSYIMIQTKMMDRPDLDVVFEDEYSYHNGGFFAKVKRRHLKKGHTYEVCLLYRSGTSGRDGSNNILVQTGSIIGGE